MRAPRSQPRESPPPAPSARPHASRPTRRRFRPHQPARCRAPRVETRPARQRTTRRGCALHEHRAVMTGSAVLQDSGTSSSSAASARVMESPDSSSVASMRSPSAKSRAGSFFLPLDVSLSTRISIGKSPRAESVLATAFSALGVQHAELDGTIGARGAIGIGGDASALHRDRHGCTGPPHDVTSASSPSPPTAPSRPRV